MFRYCSSIAFVAMLVFGCASKNNNSGDDSGGSTGGAGYVFTGGASATGGASNSSAGGSTGINASSDRNLTDLTQDEWDQITSTACLGWTAEGEMTPANIEFIVDDSGSMSDPAPNTQGQSKWDITKTALENAIGALPALTSVGLLLWPNKVTIPNNPGAPDLCVNLDAMVPLDRLGPTGSGHRNTLQQTLDTSTPVGGTPMADAYNEAIDRTFGTRGNPYLTGDKYAVLITDGQPTLSLGCVGTGEEKHPVDYHEVMTSIKATLDTLSVKTFVIGSPGSEQQSSTNADGRLWLSQAAQLGGTKSRDDCQDTGVPAFCHFDMSQVTDFSAGFTSALQTITGQILDCKYTINDSALQGKTVDFSKVNVVYQQNGSTDIGQMKLVGKASDASCPDTNGWYFDPNDSSGKTILLCPATCSRIQKDAGAVVNIRGGCETVVLIN